MMMMMEAEVVDVRQQEPELCQVSGLWLQVQVRSLIEDSGPGFNFVHVQVRSLATGVGPGP